MYGQTTRPDREVLLALRLFASGMCDEDIGKIIRNKDGEPLTPRPVHRIIQYGISRMGLLDKYGLPIDNCTDIRERVRYALAVPPAVACHSMKNQYKTVLDETIRQIVFI